MSSVLSALSNFLESTGIAKLFGGDGMTAFKTILMYVIVGVLFYLAIVKKFEPLLLLPIAFGMLLANLPGAEMMHSNFFFDEHYMSQGDGTRWAVVREFLEGLFKEGSPVFDAIRSYVPNITSGELMQNVIRYSAEGMPSLNVDYLRTLLGNEDAFNAVWQQIVESFNSNSLMTAFCTMSDDGNFHVTLATMVKEAFNNGGIIDLLYLGVKTGLYPSLIFLGIGAMTDFTPLIANPKSLMLGACAQLGVFVAFFFALFRFSPLEAASIGIIGGADGPTAILVTKILAPQLLGAIAIAAYSYMALIPMIQPPIMKLLTTKRERSIKMSNLRNVSQLEKVIFPILVTLIVTLIVPDAAPLVGCLMLGNLFNVCGVTERLSKTAQNELINIVTIFLGVSVGATASAENFLSANTLFIIALGLVAFAISTVGGLLGGKVMCALTHGKVNPLIGSAGVSAVPMAARVAQDVGRKEDPSNFLLMHAMGPNVAGVIGSAVAAGFLLSWFA